MANAADSQQKPHVTARALNLTPTEQPNFDTLPGCIGYLGHPIGPNGPCEECGYAAVCKATIPAKLWEKTRKEKVPSKN